MNTSPIFFTLFVLLIASSEAQLPLIERLRERIAERRAQPGTVTQPVELSYGKNPLQKLDYWKPTKAASPLVIFVHGGGWKRGEFMHDTYIQAFGSEKERQLTLSPTSQASAPNAPAFLILHVQRVDGAAQSRALGEALKKAGTTAEVRGFEGIGLKGHAEINRRLGDPAYPATPVVDAWLKSVFSK